MTRPTHGATSNAFAFVCLAISALFCGCAGPSTSRPAATAHTEHRHEFPLETRESATEAWAPSFTDADGKLIPAVIQRYVRAHWSAVLVCYETARRKDPNLRGRITVRYTIGEDGIPREVVDEKSTLPNREAIDCILRLFRDRLRYDPNRSGNMTILYPMELTPPPPGERKDPFFAAHDGRYGYVFDLDSASLAAAAPPPIELPNGPGGQLFSGAIRMVVHQNFNAITACYEKGKKKKPELSGIVAVKFVIGEDGRTKAVTQGDSTLPDDDVVGCVVDVFRGLRYPQSHAGNVNAVYSIQLEP